MTEYKPPQRAVPCLFLTDLGWLKATVHIPEQGFLDDVLSQAPPFIPLTKVTLLRTGREFQFLEIRLQSAHLIVPPTDEKLAPKSARAQSPVFCIIDEGTASGTLPTLSGTRVSDFFAHRRGFFPIEDASFHPFEGQARAPEDLSGRTLLVNAAHVNAVMEQPEQLVIEESGDS
jgi:hypothetical protein